MKIFNWVHRRFNNKENAKKNGVIGEDKEFEGENINNTNVFERWRGGILTIGTFGYDPLKDENGEHDDVFSYSMESEKEQFSMELDHHQSSDYETEEEEEAEEIGDEYKEEEPLVYAAYAHDFSGLMEMKNDHDHDDELIEFEYVNVMAEKKVRTTLADLFSADSEEMKKKKKKEKETMNVKGEVVKEKASRNNSSKKLGKKLLVDEARPIHKLQQLMRRMLKRKIHPDIGVTNSKVLVKKCDNNDCASLLPN